VKVIVLKTGEERERREKKKKKKVRDEKAIDGCSRTQGECKCKTNHRLSTM